MATRTSPADYRYSSEHSNYARLCRAIVDLCSDVLRDVLSSEIPPGQILHAAKGSSRLKLNIAQLVVLSDAPSHGYTDFDISLLYALIRNLCPNIQPTTGWTHGYPPKPVEVTMGDDIERIRLMKNQVIGHTTTTSITDAQFKQHWKILQDVMNRMDSRLGGSYAQSLSEIEQSSMHLGEVEESMFMDQVQQKDQDLTIPRNIKQVHENRIHAWILDDKTFVNTRASQSVKESITSKDFVAVTGVAGSGKSAIIHHVALELQSGGYNIMPVDTVDDILKFWSKDSKQVFILDDPYGIHSLDDEEVNKWDRRIKSLQECLKYKVKILVSTRKNVSKEKKIAKILENFKHEIVDINGENISLTEDEMKKILEIHMKNTLKPVEDFCPSGDFLSFPLLCRIFSSIQTSLPVNAFFQRPLKVLQEDILQLRNGDNLKYFCLVICLVYDGRLDERVCDTNNADRETKLKRCDFLELCGLIRSTPRTVIHQTLESLIGIYLIKEGSAYAFIHDILFDVVLSTLLPEFQVAFLKHCSTTFLKERVKFPEMVEENKDDVHGSLILGHESLVKAWRDRIVHDLNLSEDMSHELLKDCLLHGIPLEVLSMDDISIELYIEALKHGQVELHDTRIMVMGPFDVGKTALTKRLLKIPFEIKERCSTESADLHKEKCIFDVKNGQWILDKEQIENVLSNEQRRAKLFRNPISVESSDLSNKESTSEEKSSTDEAGSFARNSGKGPEVKSETEILYQRSPHNTMEQEKTIERKPVLTSFNHKEHKRFKTDLTKTIELWRNKGLDPNQYGEVTFWDFGGQHIYYSTHHIYLTHRAIYTVVLDMRKKLSDFVEGDRVFVDIRGEEKWNYGDFLVFWLTSIYTYGKKAPVILVGTHAAEVQPEYRTGYRGMILQFLQKNYPHLGKIVERIFTLDNHPNHSDEDFEEIRQFIYALSSKREEYWGNKFPARWFELENELKSSDNIVPLSVIREINSKLEVPLPKADLNLFLRLQHALGKYVYFDQQNGWTSENLCDFVVLNPQWLVDALKCIITSEQFCEKECRWFPDWLNLKETAKLDDELLNCLWKNAGLDKNFLGNKQILLEFLKHLDIIAPVQSKSHNSSSTGEMSHFIPCMLQATIPEKTLTSLRSCYQKHSSTLCYKLQEFIPSAVFHRLTVACMAKWPIFEISETKQIFCGCVIFDLDESHNTILLITFVKHVINLQILMKQSKEENRQQVLSVREFIDKKISSILLLYEIKVPMDRVYFIKCQEADLYSVEGMHSVEELRVKNERITCTKHESVNKAFHDLDPISCLQWWFSNIKETENQSQENVPGRSTADFRKMVDDTQSARLSDMKSLCNKSVGYIVTPKGTGTGFRVGSKYVMTCWHVLEKIVEEETSILGTPVTSHNERKLDQPGVFIEFDYKQRGIHLPNNAFHFVGRIPYYNISLDVLILELKKNGRSLPPKITKFDKPDPNKGHPLHRPSRR